MVFKKEETTAFAEGFRSGKTEASLEGLAHSMDILRAEQLTVRNELLVEHKKIKDDFETFKLSLPCNARKAATAWIVVILLGAWAALGGLFYALLEHSKKG